MATVNYWDPNVPLSGEDMGMYDPYGVDTKTMVSGLTQEQQDILSRNIGTAREGGYEIDPNNLSAWQVRGFANPNYSLPKEDSGFFGALDRMMPTTLSGAMKLFGALFNPWTASALGAGAGAGATAGGAGMGIPELGMVADAGTAATATAGGIPSSMLGSAGSTLSNFAFSPEATSGGAMDTFGSMNPSGTGSVFTGAPAAGGGGFFSNLITSPVGTLTNAVKSFLSPSGGSDTTSSLWGPLVGGGSMPWDTITSAGSILTGLMGMNERKKLQQAGMKAAEMQDPFGSQRPQYQQMLAKLMADPSSITSVPGFDAGRLAVERSMAAQGYSPARSKVSGNFLDAMSNYGGNFYNQELARLMQLAGAGIGPSGGNLALSGQVAGSQVAGNSIQSIIAGLKGLLT